MDLAYERRGSGPPLVLLHGIGHHWQAWLPVLDLLAAAHDVIAIDLPGFGASPPLPPGTPYDMDTLADAVEDFCADLGVREPHVAGNSMGGYLALTLAARGVVASATALSPAGFWNHPELIYARIVLTAMRAYTQRVPDRKAETVAASASGRGIAAALLVARPDRLSPAALAAAGRALRDSAGFDETVEALALVMPPAPAKSPITIAWGERDRLLVRRQAVRAARWSGQRVRLLPGCGHVPMSDDPELVAQVVATTTRAARA
ncbi:alpha/beta fold hydrolase [Spongiactinospora sp. TRM90649]|uniref:alpha/beta fold hydrolase n=1 Tax=Spongiactinospora sp. TRM90649 TaxID=3031114 RepID=UPI0023F6CCB5|nr:alpha/beta fold hydrolase [Spongiactinospora sp. TRM90649]MDF5751593.1 alpha/beta fold hydrolase [Spongiactinospora sp. TRM90649]